MASEWVENAANEISDNWAYLQGWHIPPDQVAAIIRRHADAELDRLREAARPIAKAIKHRVAQAEAFADGNVQSVTLPQIPKADWEQFLAAFKE